MTQTAARSTTPGGLDLVEAPDMSLEVAELLLAG